MEDNIKLKVRYLFFNKQYHFLFRHGKEYTFKMPGNWAIFGMTGSLAVGDVVYVRDAKGRRHPVIITEMKPVAAKELRNHKRIYKPKSKIKFTTHAKLPVHAPVLDPRYA